MKSVSESFGYPSIPSKQQRVWAVENKDWYIEEKLDGSQLSFTRDEDGVSTFFNRGHQLCWPYGWVFDRAISALSTLHWKEDMHDLILHGECIAKPKHNVNHYGRVPRFFFVLFDVQSSRTGEFMDRRRVEEVARALDLECVQLFWQNEDEHVQPSAIIERLMDSIEQGLEQSMLGGEKPEGLVLKHPRFTKNNGKQAASKFKYVRNAFKEKHKKPSKLANKQDLTAEESITRIMSWYSKEARWQKATQRLRDHGKITGEPENAIKERTAIMDEARRDFHKEEEENLKRLLWAEFGQRLVQSITHGMGEVPADQKQEQE